MTQKLIDLKTWEPYWKTSIKGTLIEGISIEGTKEPWLNFETWFKGLWIIKPRVKNVDLRTILSNHEKI